MDVNPTAVIKRFAAGLSDEGLKYLAPRLDQGYAGDFAEALSRLESDPEVAALLASAPGFKEFEFLVETAARAVQAEAKRRQRPPRRR